jgi:carboxypeptidase Q
MLLRPRFALALLSLCLSLLPACRGDQSPPLIPPPAFDGPTADLADEADDDSDEADGAGTSAIPKVEGDAVVQAVVRLGHTDNHVMDHLRHLTEEIGPRLTGSHRLMQAERWCTDELTRFGLQARLERWGEVPVGFDRGPWSGGMVSPERIDYDFVTPSWTPGLLEAKAAPAVPYPATVAEAKARRKELAGAWVVQPAKPGLPEALREKIDAVLDEADIAGIVRTDGDASGKLVHTWGRPKIEWGDLPEHVTIVLRHDQHADLVQRLAAKAAVQLAFSIDNRFFRGPVPQHNVVADLRGTELPDEVVIVGGHLDSWDGATGANDNATGVATTMEAARLLTAAGARPRRTIRFMLWTGEEQGLLGSSGYVEAHAGEMPQVSAVFVHDMGTNYLSGIGVTPEMMPQMQAAFAPVQQLAPEAMPFVLREAESLESGGSDHTPFIRAGVPGFFWDQDGESEYDFVHHTQHDTLQHVIEAYQRHSAMVVALAAYQVANLPALVDRRNSAPIPRRRMGARLRDGLVVEEVDPGEPAAKAGWKVGDRIVSVDGETPDGVRAVMKAMRAGEPKKTVVIERGGKRITTTLDWAGTKGEQEREARRRARAAQGQAPSQ